jgi:hemolysin activation/secretion protein
MGVRALAGLATMVVAGGAFGAVDPGAAAGAVSAADVASSTRASGVSTITAGAAAPAVPAPSVGPAAASAPPPAVPAHPAPLASAVIEGSSIYSPLQLFAAYRAQLGRPISRSGVQAIIATLESMYVRDGYWQPALQVQELLSGSGILKITVVEPQIATVSIHGDPGPYRAALENLAEPLRGAHAVRARPVQLALQRMRALPGLTLNATLEPQAGQSGRYTLVINAAFRHLIATLQWTDRGTSTVGPNFLLGQAAVNDVLGIGDQLGVFAGAAVPYGEYHGAGVFADLPVDAQDTHLYAMAFRSLSDPSEPAGDLPAQYLRHLATLRFTQPLNLVPALDTLAVTAGLYLDDFIVDQGNALLQADRLRVAELGMHLGWHRGDVVQYDAVLALRQGLNALGAGVQTAAFPSLTPQDLENAGLPDPKRRDDFMLMRWQITRIQVLTPRWTLRLDLLGQDTDNALPYVEQFKIGGETLGRGFAVAEITGDQGLGGRAEVRRSFAFAGALSRFGTLSLYGDYDLGAVWRQDLPGRQSAASAGSGIALNRSRASFYLEADKPLTHRDINGTRDTLLFGGAAAEF